MLKSLHLQNFRSVSDSTFEFGSKTVIYGPNGSGKTTLTEAIRILSVNKSFRSARFDEAIAFDTNFFRLSGQIAGEKLDTIEFFYGQAFAEQEGKDRLMTVNGKTTSLLEFIGTFPTVLFIPSDIDIVLGSPQLRRKYIDGVLWQINAEFRQAYLQLQRVLRERSSLLFLIKINRAGLDELRPWNELLLSVTNIIRQARSRYLEQLKAELEQLVDKSDRAPALSVEYEIAAEEIETVLPSEIKNGQNFFGPHRDDIEITINHRSARKYASRGQARTAIAMLKVGEAVILQQQLRRPPTILLDDIFSELDQKNSQFLFAKLPKESQIIVTSLEKNKLLENWQEITLHGH